MRIYNSSYLQNVLIREGERMKIERRETTQKL
jgi:hypothetical protein